MSADNRIESVGKRSGPNHGRQVGKGLRVSTSANKRVLEPDCASLVLQSHSRVAWLHTLNEINQNRAQKAYLWRSELFKAQLAVSGASGPSDNEFNESRMV